MIEVENLGKTYVAEPVVRDLSFFVPEGQVLGFLGPNGAGKTTVMRMLTAFLPPTTGRVVVAGVDLDQDPVGLRRNVGYLPENVPLYPEMRVDEYLRFRADDRRASPRARSARRTDDVVDRCLHRRRSAAGDRHPVQGLPAAGRPGRRADPQPPVLILDEPTVGLDPNQIIKVRELITELGRDHTVLLSTHILPEVEQVCERVFIIDRGRVVADGTPEALRAKLVGNPSLAVELKGANDSARTALEALPGVVGDQRRGEGRYPARARPPVPTRVRRCSSWRWTRGWVLARPDPAAGIPRGRLCPADDARGARWCRLRPRRCTMRKIWAIIRRELIAYFSSPLAYIVMTAFLLMQGYIFYLIVSFLNNPQTPAMTPMRLFFGGTIFFWLFLLFVVPVITMRLIAEERRSGTIEVLLTSPVTEAQVVVGKFVAAHGLLCRAVVADRPLCVVLKRQFGDRPRSGCSPAIWECSCSVFFFLAVGTFCSTLTNNQLIAAIIAFAAMVALFSIGLVEQLMIVLFVHQIGARSDEPLDPDGRLRQGHRRYPARDLSAVGGVCSSCSSPPRALEVKKWR